MKSFTDQLALPVKMRGLVGYRSFFGYPQDIAFKLMYFENGILARSLLSCLFSLPNYVELGPIFARNLITVRFRIDPEPAVMAGSNWLAVCPG